MKKSQKIMLAVNLIMIAAICLTNFFYQYLDFMRVLKCTCSALFTILGAINLVYAYKTKQSNMKFYVSMMAGLFFAFLGDVLIDWQFIPGAAVFALGHVCFVIAYGFIQKIKTLDCVIGGSVFAACVIFLFSPLVTFDVPVFRIVCLVYSLIIASMLGKAIGNFVRNKNKTTATIAAASFLFFFSDLMLLFANFSNIEVGATFGILCLATYYPAEILLALSLNFLPKKEEQAE